VELADTRMDRAARIRPRPTPSELAVEIKDTYFARRYGISEQSNGDSTDDNMGSPSALHTPDAIEIRYITVFLKWDDADEQMRYAARNTYHEGKKFRIGAVVDHIKKTFFSSE
jgi:hypothetical protein